MIAAADKEHTATRASLQKELVILLDDADPIDVARPEIVITEETRTVQPAFHHPKRWRKNQLAALVSALGEIELAAANRDRVSNAPHAAQQANPSATAR